MASSKKPASSDLLQSVSDRLHAQLTPGRHVTVALSGGVDSVVLLHLLHRLQRERAFSLSAIHVNHQISPNAADWAGFCGALCAKLHVPLVVKNIRVPRRSQAGLEAAARTLRYRAFAELDTDCLLLAHHLDDQAETVLLNLLRGAGVRGAAAMPEVRRQGEGAPIVRPLLEVPRAALLAYAKRHRLAWIEDESNLDAAFTRNYLRHAVLPAIEQRFPAYRQTLTRAARHFAEADSLLDELAAIDMASVARDGQLKLALLQEYSPVRAKNLMRAYFASQGMPALDADRLDEWLRQLVGARGDSRMELGVAGLVLRRYRGEIWIEPDTPCPAADWQITWRGERELALPELGGRWSMIPVQGEGLSVAKLGAAPMTLRLRQGGEKLKPDCGRPRKTLKHLLQEAAIPPWQRERLPLLYRGETLVAAPGIGIDCAYQAAPGEPGLWLAWVLTNTQ
ncbi:MAG: tRNA lysidine(34) synthetase TilS [Burkholderiales bacterium]|nr:tRNA lysidine(34) synthetase TilS [Burkholderiales bacterium]